MSNLLATDKYCGWIQNKKGPFAECIAKFPKISEEFFESCRIDVCSLEGSNLDVAKCEAVEAFAEECADNGVTVTWRSRRFCRKYIIIGRDRNKHPKKKRIKILTA